MAPSQWLNSALSWSSRQTDRAQRDPTTICLISSSLIGLLCRRNVSGDIKEVLFAALQITGYRAFYSAENVPAVGKRQIIRLNILI